MAKKVFIVSASLRRDSNSEKLAKEFADGATKAGNTVKFVSLKDLKFNYCLGCLYCQRSGECVQNDPMKATYEEVGGNDVLVFATPMYYDGLPGQMKAFIDRLNPLYQRNNCFKDVYILGACSGDKKEDFDPCVSQIKHWVDRYEGVQIKGCVVALNTTFPNDVADEFLDKAYKLGSKIE